MSMKYLCPECRTRLSTHGVVILTGERENDAARSLFVFDARPGQFDFVVVDDEITIKPGGRWTFYCPVCRADLTTKFNKRLARVELVDGEHVRRVVFSKVANEQATFVLGGDEIEAHGKDSTEYLETSK